MRHALVMEANDMEQILAEIDAVDRGILGCVSTHQLLLLDTSAMWPEGGRVISLMVGRAARRGAATHLQAPMHIAEQRMSTPLLLGSLPASWHRRHGLPAWRCRRSRPRSRRPCGRLLRACPG